MDPGTRLGPYEVVSLLATGGMGEVYKGRDTRLDRIVAIKILSADLAADPAFRERFNREARAISSLDHPHICALYDVGQEDGVAFLVMQYLEGETLADRLAKGALPLDQALSLASQIAGALDRAHRAGVVHRDLKPGNVMLTKSGARLLDFGLAKNSPGGVAGSAAARDGRLGRTSTPTMQAPLTQHGMLLGTYQYMAPEQIDGDEVDARVDIFAFGAVLYEMVTGRKAFTGKSQASLIGAILTTDPPSPSSVQPLAPSALDRIVRKCLAKDPDARWQTARDLADEIDWVIKQAPYERQTTFARPPSSAPATTRWKAAALAQAILIAVLGTIAIYRAPGTATHEITRFQIGPPATFSFSNLTGNANAFANTGAVSPDGSQLAFVAGDMAGHTRLWLRSFNAFAPRAVPGTDEAAFPFWSPDGRFVAFFVQGRLRRVATNGGAPETITSIPSRGRGATWGSRDEIIFAVAGSPGLFRVSAAGGQPRPVDGLASTNADRVIFEWPAFLPDGRHFLYSAGRRGDDARRPVYIGTLDGGAGTRLLESDSNALFAQPNSVLFVRDGILLRQALNMRSLAPIGEAAHVTEDVAVDQRQHLAAFSVSATAIIYRTGGDSSTQFTWVDRTGRILSTVGSPGLFRNPTFDRKEQRLLFSRSTDAANWDIWFLKLPAAAMSRITFSPGAEGAPVWWKDDTILYWHRVEASGGIFARSVTSGGSEELILNSPTPCYPYSLSPDRSTLLYVDAAANAFDIHALSLDRDRRPLPLVQSRFHDDGPQFSPDGRFFAYFTDESGRFEVFVQPFPPTGARWQISNEGGLKPMWRPDGNEVFFVRQDGRLFGVPVQGNGRTLQIDPPAYLFDLKAAFNSTRNSYLVGQDGKTFLVNMTVESPPSPINVVLNWSAEPNR